MPRLLLGNWPTPLEPHEPARTFLEGLQACWLVHVAMNLEDIEQGMSFGRPDQILWPLYQADVAAGRLTPGP
ncbi:MAG: pyruvate formate lyase family protein, partial [Bacillota bacterium]